MKYKIKIIPIEEHEKVFFYSVTINGDSDCEFFKFHKSLIAAGKKGDLGKITYLLSKIAEYGPQDRHFRPAGKINDNVWELPDHYLIKSKYRLYCLRYGAIIIIGNGGLKTTRTYQEDSHLNECVETLQKIDEKIRFLLDRGKLTFDVKDIKGENEFKIKK